MKNMIKTISIAIRLPHKAQKMSVYREIQGILSSFGCVFQDTSQLFERSFARVKNIQRKSVNFQLIYFGFKDYRVAVVPAILNTSPKMFIVKHKDLFLCDCVANACMKLSHFMPPSYRVFMFKTDYNINRHLDLGDYYF